MRYLIRAVVQLPVGQSLESGDNRDGVWRAFHLVLE
jgi:hypothetical protein